MKYFYTEHLTLSICVFLFSIWFYFCIIIKVSENNLYRYLYYSYAENENQDLFEALQNVSFRSFKNIIWFTFITMSTIGYGDIYPYSLIARLFTGILGIVALVISSFLTVATTGFFM